MEEDLERFLQRTECNMEELSEITGKMADSFEGIRIPKYPNYQSFFMERKKLETMKDKKDDDNFYKSLGYTREEIDHAVYAECGICREIGSKKFFDQLKKKYRSVSESDFRESYERLLKEGKIKL